MERGRPFLPPASGLATEVEAKRPAPVGPEGLREPGSASPVEGCLPNQLAFTVKQLAGLLGTTPKSIYHRSERGQLPGPFRIGRTLMFRRSDLVRFMAEGRGPSRRE